ncbi:hypothetical protein [Streptomyces albus]|uniref:hypothetical protein n=1 Tax=Streptomyces albus TaxID=1888 RepID=UPI0010813B9E|nr:hypothetical protein [Streptomyces albus]UVN59502.1 hypothetical protein NR995_33780 [Streptomyces albus]
MRTHVTQARIGAVAGIAAAAILGGSPAASAVTAPPSEEGVQVQNWSSSMYDVLTGFQSRRWHDKDYSQVWFTKCRVSGATGTSTHVDLRWDRTAQPDVSWGTKKYTQCFKGSSGKSNGEWHNLSSGDHFFQIKLINGSSSGLALSVSKVTVDTSKADS